MSSNREQILDLFKKNHTLTAVDVLEKLPDMDKSTVYRNINRLVKSGEIKEIATIEEAATYELAKKKHHHHVICKKCGVVKSYKPPYALELQVRALEQIIEKSRKIKIEEHNLDFYGVCSNCKKK